MQVYDQIEQGSPEWYRLRCGLPTSSMFATIMASGKGGGESQGRLTYLYKLAGERLTGEPAENFTNAAMERGKVMEEEARRHYAFVRDCAPEQIGFIKNGKSGCSPDSLIGDDGLLEIKTTVPHLLIPLLLKGTFPPAHRAQCQGALMVSERRWIDICIYWPKMKALIVRAERDEDYITELRNAVDVFDLELRRLVEKLK